ncbi:hypothetical protein V5O48_019709, partial [Marasmius crinis-equi]
TTPTDPPPADILSGSSHASSSGSDKPRNANREGQAEGGAEKEAEHDGEGEEGEGDEDGSGKALSILHPDKVAYFGTLLPTFLALGTRSHEKKLFWEAFPSSFFDKFPIEEYPAPVMGQKAQRADML